MWKLLISNNFHRFFLEENESSHTLISINAKKKFKCNILYVKQFFNKSSFSMETIFSMEAIFSMRFFFNENNFSMQAIFPTKIVFQCKNFFQ